MLCAVFQVSTFNLEFSYKFTDLFDFKTHFLWSQRFLAVESRLCITSGVLPVLYSTKYQSRSSTSRFLVLMLVVRISKPIMNVDI